MTLTFGAWNVLTLTDNAKADRPEGRTALVARELGCYIVDIAALSETRLVDEADVAAEKAMRQVSDSPSSLISCGKLASLLRAYGRLMTLQLPLGSKKSITLISAYAPTMTNPGNVKDKFCEELDSLISAVPTPDKLIVLGDFNARVGTDYQIWEEIVGRHGVGKSNSNGLLLLKTCATHDLIITNTMFRLTTRNKTSWMHPRSKHWHLIDYVITRKKDRQDVQHAHPASATSSRKEGCEEAQRLQAKNSLVAEAFSEDLKGKLEGLQLGHATAEEDWAVFRDTVYATALEHLGPTSPKHQDWFDENDEQIKALLAEKHRLLRAHQNDPSLESKKVALANMRRTIQMGQGKTDKAQILERSAEHFNGVLNRPSSINDEAIARMPQVEVDTEIDAPPNVQEVKKAVNQLLDLMPFLLRCTKQEILARVLLNRLNAHLEQDLLPESHCGFRAGRGTVGMVFAARQLQEKCQEQHRELLTTFVDMTKAFDTVRLDVVVGRWSMLFCGVTDGDPATLTLPSDTVGWKEAVTIGFDFVRSYDLHPSSYNQDYLMVEEEHPEPRWLSGSFESSTRNEIIMQVRLDAVEGRWSFLVCGVTDGDAASLPLPSVTVGWKEAVTIGRNFARSYGVEMDSTVGDSLADLHPSSYNHDPPVMAEEEHPEPRWLSGFFQLSTRNEMIIRVTGRQLV
ncbi:hypothetical protein BaRGS_00020553, partial [Batillaria attramentaria]